MAGAISGQTDGVALGMGWINWWKRATKKIWFDLDRCYVHERVQEQVKLKIFGRFDFVLLMLDLSRWRHLFLLRGAYFFGASACLECYLTAKSSPQPSILIFGKK